MASAPAELRRASLLTRADCDELIGAVASRLGDGDPAADMRAGVLVRAAVAAVEYACRMRHGPFLMSGKRRPSFLSVSPLDGWTKL